jgi:hypothetical protein
LTENSIFNQESEEKNAQTIARNEKKDINLPLLES